MDWRERGLLKELGTFEDVIEDLRRQEETGIGPAKVGLFLKSVPDKNNGLFDQFETQYKFLFDERKEALFFENRHMKGININTHEEKDKHNILLNSSLYGDLRNQLTEYWEWMIDENQKISNQLKEKFYGFLERDLIKVGKNRSIFGRLSGKTLNHKFKMAQSKLAHFANAKSEYAENGINISCYDNAEVIYSPDAQKLLEKGFEEGWGKDYINEGLRRAYIKQQAIHNYSWIGNEISDKIKNMEVM